MTGLRLRVARIRGSRALRAEVAHLIGDGEVAVLHPLAGMDMSDRASGDLVREVVTDLLTSYRAMRAPERGRVLLHHPLALLPIPATPEAYLDAVGPKTRNVIRKAGRTGYEFREFDWNDHLEEIYEVNTSSEIRRGRPMEGWYAEPVEPREMSEHRRYYGAFKGGRLYGYLHVAVCGDFAFVRHFIGHAEHLTNGIMNGLILTSVERYAGDSPVKWLKYGPFVDDTDSLNVFKRHAGFGPYATFLELDGDAGLTELARREAVRPWRGL